MDKCMRQIRVNANGEETLAYADDVAVVTRGAEQLQEVVNRWNQGMKDNGMKINTSREKQNLQ